MPDKKGRPTRGELVFAEAFARTDDRKYAGEKAGFAHPEAAASKLLQRPAVVADIHRQQVARLENVILPLALDVHESMLRNEKTPAGARAALVKLAYDRAWGSEGDGGGKEPHEMTSEEIGETLAKLRREAAERARPVIDATAEPPAPDPAEELAKPGVFD